MISLKVSLVLASQMLVKFSFNAAAHTLEKLKMRKLLDWANRKALNIYDGVVAI
jgi:hypothetical protein